MKLIIPVLLLATVADAATSAAPPAALSKEGDLTTIVLTAEAEGRLRLNVVPVERRAIPDTRLFSGEVVLPLAAAGATTAPVIGGTLDELLRIADQQAAADGRVAQAQAQVDAARIALARAEKVLRAEAGSQRTVDEVKATLSLAEAALQTAIAQRKILGAPVSEAARAGRSWVRVSIYSGEAALLDPSVRASVRDLTRSSASVSAQPVSGPLTANALANTIDWYYELPSGNAHRPGERVEVEIQLLESKTENLVVPFNAVLHDIHGGQWVYENTRPHTYVRRRIQVARIAGDQAVLASGPAVGAQIVTDGSAELFGTEFLTGK